MPKLKTHKGAQARFHVTGTGKLLRMKGGKSHLRRKKLAKVRRAYHTKLPLSPADKKHVARALPYSI